MPVNNICWGIVSFFMDAISMNLIKAFASSSERFCIKDTLVNKLAVAISLPPREFPLHEFPQGCN
jgi:hypothetical protein